MSRLIKIIDENTIELADYRCPEVIFKNSQTPPTLQNIKDEIECLEWYCTFKATINPFQLYAENEMLHSIIKEVREIFKDYGEKEDIVGYTMYNITGEMLLKLLEILDKAGDEK